MTLADIVEANSPTLRDLATTANEEHQLVLEAGSRMLEHAVRAGDALLAAHAQVDRGKWLTWVEQNIDDYGYGAVNVYMRLARHKAYLAERRPTTISAARSLLVGLPLFDDETSHLREEAQRLRDQGKTYAEIADLLGLSQGSHVWQWLNPDGYKKSLERTKLYNRRRRAERKALERQERNSAIKVAVKKAGGAQAEAYAMAERMQDVLGKAHREATDPEARREYALAGEHYRKMRDHIVSALGVC